MTIDQLLQRLRGRLAYFQLSGTAKAVLRNRLTYLGPAKFKRLEQVLRGIVRDDVPGDVVEFGIALGGSGIVLAKKAIQAGRQFHGFDVFGMIPPPTSEKDDEKSKQRYEVIATGKSKGIRGDLYYGYRSDLYEEVCASFAHHGVPVDSKQVFLHKGFFETTLPSYNSASVAFAHIDCDWYDPVCCCLDAVAERLSPGGVIILDDYHDYGGCRRATDEFLAKHREFELRDGANVLLLKRTVTDGASFNMRS